MKDIALFILLGLGAGAVLAGIAMAVVVTYSGSGIINLATGAVSFSEELSDMFGLDPAQPVTFDGLSLAEWQKLGKDDGSSVADPLFAAPRENDFRLQPNSPAFKLGFQPIDLSHVGP